MAGEAHPVKFNRLKTKAQIGELTAADSQYGIYFATDGDIFVGQAGGAPVLKANIGVQSVSQHYTQGSSVSASYGLTGEAGTQPTEANDVLSVIYDIKADAAGHVAGYKTINVPGPTAFSAVKTTANAAVRQVNIGSTEYTPTTGVVSLPAYPTTLPASDTTNTYSSTGTVPVSGTAVASAISSFSATDIDSTDNDKGITVSLDGTVGAPTIDITVDADTLVSSLGLSAAMHFVGESSSDPKGSTGATVSGHTTWKAGDVVLYGNKEFVLKNTTNAAGNWVELGDEGSHALNTISITGGKASGATYGLNGGGDLTANRVITLDSTTNTAIGQGVTAYGWGNHADAGYQAANTAVTHSANTAVGSTSVPVYIAQNGTATACEFSVLTSVPANAVFTDTHLTDALTITDGTNTAVTFDQQTAKTLAVEGAGLTTVAATNGKLTITSTETALSLGTAGTSDDWKTNLKSVAVSGHVITPTTTTIPAATASQDGYMTSTQASNLTVAVTALCWEGE